MSCCCWVEIAIIAAVLYAIRYLLSKVPLSAKKQRVVLITGCDTGFGNMLANQLSDKKYNVKVLAGCLMQKSIAELSKKENIVPFLLDVTDEKSVAAVAEVLKKECKSDGLHAVVNNAGVLRAGLAETAPIEDLKFQLNINLIGMVMMCKACIPFIRVARGRIINVASVAGRFATPMTSYYNASKFAVEGYSDALRREMNGWGIQVIVIEPGIMKTPLWNVPTSEAEFNRTWGVLNEEQKKLYGRKFFEQGREKSLEFIGKLAGNPQLVVNTMISAVTSRFPYYRYRVGVDASAIFIPFSFMPDFIGDFLWNLLSQPPKPAALEKK